MARDAFIRPMLHSPTTHLTTVEGHMAPVITNHNLNHSDCSHGCPDGESHLLERNMDKTTLTASLMPLSLDPVCIREGADKHPATVTTQSKILSLL